MFSIKSAGHLFVFGLCFAAGAVVASLFTASNSDISVSEYKCGRKAAVSRMDAVDLMDVPAPPRAMSKNVQILAKPRPQYTDAARGEAASGTVILKVTFLADGNIGPIKVVKGLESGLTQAAIDAAKKIQFEPAMSSGHPIAVVKQMEYSFSTY